MQLWARGLIFRVRNATLGQGPVKFVEKKHLDYLNWENLMQSKRTGLPFSMG